MPRLTARILAVESEADDRRVAFAEQSDGTGWSLTFQRAGRFDDQDRSLGQATYSVSNEIGATVYGGLRGWQLRGSTLELDWTPDVREVLGLPSPMEIDLAIDERELANVDQALRSITRPY